ncbi:hypothetical protein V8G54_003252, partial [Vigna mungo]
GSDAIQCISLYLVEQEVIVDGQAFQKMDNLKMLIFDGYFGFGLESNVFLASSLVTLPDTLKILYWKGFPQRSLPLNFCPENLVRLEMPDCHLEQLWEEDQVFQSLPKLKRLNLSSSHKLKRIQDLSLSPNIEEIILSGCVKLKEVYSSTFLSELSCLCLEFCWDLRSVNIPSNILSRSPGCILFTNCDNLEMFSTGQTQICYSPPSLSLIAPIFPHVKLARQLQRGHSIEEHSSTSENPSGSYYSRIFSITFDRYWEADEENEVTNNNIYAYDEMTIQFTGEEPLNFLIFKELCFIDLSNCSSLTIFPFNLSEMKFLKKLCLGGCSKLQNFPEIEDTMEDLEVLILERTAIEALPSSLWRLVGLQELSLSGCWNLEIIPSSIGSLTRLRKLDLTYCESLQTFPSTIFKLKLRKLDLCGCLRLRTFPEITEQAQTFSHINLTETAIKDLPSSFGNLVNLRSLQLNKCMDLESLPNSIVNLKLLFKLDCSGCAKLTEIPAHIDCLWSLMELSLSESGIVNLPESIAHLSSLKSLDLSGCKNLECIPQIPPFLKQLVALDCTSIRRVMSNGNRLYSAEGVFKFHLTNAQRLDSGARANIEEDARLRMTDDAYKSVFFCFPGSAVPHWFPFRSEGSSVTINEDLSFCSDDRLIGFALCVVFGLLDANDINGRHGSFSYSLKLEYDNNDTQIISNNDVLINYFNWNGKERVVNQDHTFMWKFDLESLRTSGMNLGLCDARSFNFEISPLDSRDYRLRNGLLSRSSGNWSSVGECGLLPGSDAIQCILLDENEMEEVEVHPNTFEMMNNLRMLMIFPYCWGQIISHVVVRESFLVSLPDTLKILCWNNFPQRSLPSNLCLQNLVRLEMPNCRLEQLWERDQNLPKLKRLNLSNSRKLTRIPDLSLSPNIKEIILSYCERLIQVHSSRFLSKLSCLLLNGCYGLKSVTIPSNILTRSPGFILLSDCHQLEMFQTCEIQSRPFSLLSSIWERPSYRFGDSMPFTRLDPSEIFSITFDRYEEEEKEVINNHIYLQCDEVLTKLRKGVPLNFQSLKKFCFLDVSNCSSLSTFPCDLSETKFLKQLCLRGCSKLENFPEIEDTVEGLAVLILDGTAIQALPSSLWRLVGLEQLSLRGCKNLEIIPSSIGSLTRLCKLDLTSCQSLQTFPNTIFKLKLRILDFCGCLRLSTFPEITEQAQTFSHINLKETAIKELPSSFGNLVNLRSLLLNKCTDLESLPNSIVNLKCLRKLDCSGCAKLTEIPTHIGRLSSLMEMSLRKSGIVNLPESMAHLSSLKSLDLSDCKKLECIPPIPPFLKQLVALDCPSIRRVIPNSLVRNLSESKEGVFKFHFTNAQQLDSGARANIEEDARLKMTDDAYRCVFFCFPGTAVPHWFPFRGNGPSLSINEDLSFCSDDRLIGFALCVVFELLDTNDIEGRYGSFSYSLKFECDDDGTQIIPNNDVLNNYFKWIHKDRRLDQNHTFVWKFNLEPLRTRGMNLRLCDATSFTFEISPYDYDFQWPNYDSVVNELKSVVKIKECGMCPLYSSGSNVA